MKLIAEGEGTRDKGDRGSTQRVATDERQSRAKQSETGQAKELAAQIDWVGTARQIRFWARDVQER